MQRQRATIVRLAAYLCLCLAPAVLYLSGAIDPFLVGNADMLAVPAFLDAVQAHGWSTFGQWYWPPAPYFLPDFVLYGPVWLALPDPWLAPAAFMVLQLGLLAVVGRLLARELSASAAARWGAVASFATVVLLAERAVEPVTFVLASYYRAGTLMLSVAGLTVLLRQLRAGGPWQGPVRLGAVTLATAVLVASDPLAAPAAVLPLSLLVLGLVAVSPERGGWSEQPRQAFLLAGSLVAGTGLGLLANSAIVSDEAAYGPSLSADSPTEQLRQLVGLIIDLELETHLTGVVSIGVMVVAGLVSWNREQVVSGPTVALAFWSISVAGHVGAIVIDSSEPASRYLQLVIVLPILVAGPVLARLVSAASGRPAVRFGAGAALIGIVAAATVPAVVDIDDAVFRTQPVEAACLDAALPDGERLTGFSGYWEARTVQLHSRYERELATLDGLGSPYRINAAAAWFETPWSFAVIGSGGGGFDPPIEWVHKMAPDAAVSSCEMYTIFVFDPPLDPTPFDEPGDAIRWSGCELDTMIGRVDDDACIIEVPASGTTTFGSYGGYTPLPPGRFSFAFRYRSPALVRVDIADLELTRVSGIGGDVEVVASQPLSGTGGDWATVTGTFDVPDDGRNYVAELRTLAFGTFPYEVESVLLRALEPPR